VPEDQLPVVLPEDIEFDGVGSPIKKMPEFYEVDCPQCGGKAHRETDTFDTFMESSWYFARYACKDNDQVMLDERANYWLPVDQYVGGIEHAILHLLYARFYNKLLRDVGLVSNDEPFKKLLTQGMVLKDGVKMSKSKGNTVDPQALIEQYGADTVRLYTMFTSPPEQSLEWSDSGVEGAHRFLRRLWLFCDENEEGIRKNSVEIDQKDWSGLPQELKNMRREFHELLAQAKSDFSRYQFNTVVAAGMKMMNALSGGDKIAEDQWLLAIQTEGLGFMLRLLAPVAPHVTHHLWQALGYGDDILSAPWPQVDEQALVKDTIEMVVQVNGKLRGHISVPAQAAKDQVEQVALADGNVQRFVEDKTVRKVIVVPGKLVNIVAN
jgi:leucyl-tRNA synthetase